eukprot:gnl/Carplike_NY0171/6012_a8246_218.p1 GENE.gnl/Carplike_NY0171/6012_a8246_218~~gnl/Carplike_NY0171/6012_a8246_218.p1  ORF type:complete len:582 (-),score=53.56 gnl/Carplike_NY0171/6012_a8246_218:35-1780(-)
MKFLPFSSEPPLVKCTSIYPDHKPNIFLISPNNVSKYQKHKTTSKDKSSKSPHSYSKLSYFRHKFFSKFTIYFGIILICILFSTPCDCKEIVTAKPKRDYFRILVVPDTKFLCKIGTERNTSIINFLNSYCERTAPDLLIHLGDFVSADTSCSDAQLTEISELFGDLMLNHNLPFVISWGDEDYNATNLQKKLMSNTYHYSKPSILFADTSSISDSFLILRNSSGTIMAVVFVLDSHRGFMHPCQRAEELIASSGSEEEEDIIDPDLNYDGNVGCIENAQIEWLTEVLESHEVPAFVPKIITFHNSPQEIFYDDNVIERFGGFFVEQLGDATPQPMPVIDLINEAVGIREGARVLYLSAHEHLNSHCSLIEGSASIHCQSGAMAFRGFYDGIDTLGPTTRIVDIMDTTETGGITTIDGVDYLNEFIAHTMLISKNMTISAFLDTLPLGGEIPIFSVDSITPVVRFPTVLYWPDVASQLADGVDYEDIDPSCSQILIEIFDGKEASLDEDIIVSATMNVQSYYSRESLIWIIILISVGFPIALIILCCIARPKNKKKQKKKKEEKGKKKKGRKSKEKNGLGI